MSQLKIGDKVKVFGFGSYWYFGTVLEVHHYVITVNSEYGIKRELHKNIQKLTKLEQIL